MKTAMILGLIASSLIISSTSAMEMADPAMTKDTMMMSGSSDTMMHKDMMKDGMSMGTDTKMMMKKYMRMSTASLARSLGYTWSTDRAMLAEKAGVTGYTGTAKQNLMIRKYLMGMMKDGTMMKDTMTK